jgi:hypothetical protein
MCKKFAKNGLSNINQAQMKDVLLSVNWWNVIKCLLWNEVLFALQLNVCMAIKYNCFCLWKHHVNLLLQSFLKYYLQNTNKIFSFVIEWAFDIIRRPYSSCTGDHFDLYSNRGMWLHANLIIHSFIHSFVRSFIRSFIHSFVRSVIE